MPGGKHRRRTEAELAEIDPNSLEPDVEVRKLHERASKLGGAVPVRFAPEVIAAIKQIADAEHLTVSAWIRREIDASLERRQAADAARHRIEARARRSGMTTADFVTRLIEREASRTDDEASLTEDLRWLAETLSETG
ncbi:MAG TPA: hypothetical protein VNQ73_00035 [Ilumatobacter sp.]|nr:hypothetical protein [Ilumatobacter sp.]